MRSAGPARVRLLLRALLTAIAVVALLFPGAVIAGAYLPDLPIVGRFGAFLTTDLPLVMLLALVPLVAASLGVVVGGGWPAQAVGAVALLVIAGTLLGGTVMVATAASNGARFDLLRQAFQPQPQRAADRRISLANVDGTDLSAEVWLPPASAVGDSSATPAVVFVHGGAFVGGGLGERRGLATSLANAGIAFIDVEYRLAPPPRWQDAPADILCALAVVANEAAALAVDPERVVLMGESAGGSLALVAGYAAGGGLVAPSCDGAPLVPVGIIAISPAADLEGIWADRTLWFGDRPFPEAYIGGPPSEYPERYAAASPFEYLRPGLPPTLVVTGANDHLVRIGRVESVVGGLRAGGVIVDLIVVPFADHGFDGPPNGFGAQMEEDLVADFVGRVAN